MEYATLDEVIDGRGLRLVLVPTPSPWTQAAKTFFELKGVPYRAAAQEPGGANERLVAWSGQASGPVAVWEAEPPLHHWLDVLFLAERVAPEPALLPQDPGERTWMLGLAHELCGEQGIGWCRREMIFKQALDAGTAPESVRVMAARYRYTDASARQAPHRIAAVLGLLARQLAAQQAQGRRWFFGDHVSALDIYWAAFTALIAPPPDRICPLPEATRTSFEDVGPIVRDALDPALLEHRDLVFGQCFRTPMDF